MDDMYTSTAKTRTTSSQWKHTVQPST